jgi:hypothetical protein
MESGTTVGRIPEVIDGEAFLTEAFNYFWVVWISPTGCYVNHGLTIQED